MRDPDSNAASVLLTTHKVVIDANDEAHARWLVEALTNDGYRVHLETQRMIEREGMVTLERS